MNPRNTLASFDGFLAERGLRFEAVIVGGAALYLLGVISRATKDCDVLWPPLPEEIADAARTFAAAMRGQGENLADDWLNNGPASLTAQLPADWRNRLQLAFAGRAMRLHAPGREDLLRSKLFALCDRGIDLADWLEVLADLARRLGHGV
ncbi:MAG: hypothetical protein JXP73_00850 [Deltaproteobacteria bacterium]|nr:hypothetical protein [Deltaproteobacteria bacterium]